MSVEQQRPEGSGLYIRWGIGGILLGIVLLQTGPQIVGLMLGLVSVVWLLTGVWRQVKVARWNRANATR